MTLRLDYKRILAFLFVFDCAIMPVIKVLGYTYKLSYMIAFASLLLCVLPLFQGKNFFVTAVERRMAIFLALFPIIPALAQGIISFTYQPDDWTLLLKFCIGCILMLGSYFFGYYIEHSEQRFGFLFWCLMLNNFVNCVLALFGRDVPGFMQRLYSISIDTYMDGYYRNGGIIGNPNSSLLIMNVLLLCIVLFYSKGLMKLRNWQVAFLIVMPIITDIIVSSRGEFVHTIMLDAFLLFFVIRRNIKEGQIKSFLKSFLVILMVLVVLAILFNIYLLPRFSNIQLSLSRLSELEEAGSLSGRNDDMLNTYLRPFYRWAKFKDRFLLSPIIGSGVDTLDRGRETYGRSNGFHNDFFMILASGGIIYFLMWIEVFRESVKKCGLVVLAPLVITALSNTFIQSYAGTMLYFFAIGVVFRSADLLPEPESESETELSTAEETA